MPGINLKRSLATVAVAAGLLAAAGPASAATSSVSVYQHNQTDLDFILMADLGGQYRAGTGASPVPAHRSEAQAQPRVHQLDQTGEIPLPAAFSASTSTWPDPVL
jgi:hypothetical protein